MELPGVHDSPAGKGVPCGFPAHTFKNAHHFFLFSRPTPEIEWKKMGGNLPKGRESKENYGKTLKIQSVSYRDRGTYRCTATNALGAATHDFHVTVEGTSPPGDFLYPV